MDPKHELKLMTIEELAKWASSVMDLNQARINWPFETVDFAIADEFADQDDLETVKANSSGWYGIHSVDCGFDSDCVALAVDYYGGGCLQVVSVFSGMGEEGLATELQNAILAAMGFTNEVNGEIRLICEMSRM